MRARAEHDKLARNRRRSCDSAGTGQHGRGPGFARARLWIQALYCESGPPDKDDQRYQFVAAGHIVNVLYRAVSSNRKMLSTGIWRYGIPKKKVAQKNHGFLAGFGING